jgi:hypothetical protein
VSSRRHGRAVVAAAALAACALALPGISPAANPKAFSGNVCSLLPAKVIPSEVHGGCHRLETDQDLLSTPREPIYRAVIGGSQFTTFTPATHEFLLTVTQPKNAEQRSSFKDIVSMLAAVNGTKAKVVKVGSWAREVQYKGAGGATFAELTFVVGGYACTELWAKPHLQHRAARRGARSGRKPLDRHQARVSSPKSGQVSSSGRTPETFTIGAACAG